MRRLLVLVACLAVIACSGRTELLAPVERVDVSAGDKYEALMRALCDAVERCQPDALTDRSECDVLVRNDYTSPFWPPQAAYRSGTARLIEREVDACIESTKTLDCDLDIEPFSACTRVFEGQLPSGAPCVADAECDGTAHCARDALELCGRCRRLATIGEPCDGLCTWGAHCDFTEGVCVRDADIGDACEVRFDCRGDLVCVRERGDSTCRRPAGLGEPCDLANGLTCRVGDRLACESGVCAAVTSGLAQAGEPCSELVQCTWDAFCDFPERKCQLREGSGAECSGTWECESGLLCADDDFGSQCMDPTATECR